MPRTNPPLPAITGNVFRVQFWIQTWTDFQIVTQDYLGATPSLLVASDLENVVTTCHIAHLASSPGVLTASSQVIQTVGSCLSNLTIPSFTLVASSPPVGTATGFPLPLTVAAVITKQTLVGGQHGRGRCYPWAVPDSFSSVDADTITTAAVSAYTTWYTTVMFSAKTAGLTTYNPCVATAGHPVTKAGVQSSFIIRTLLGNIRRRRLGRGI